MIEIFIIALIAIAAAIQFFHVRNGLKRLIYQNTLNRELAEPEQILTLSSTVRNIGRVPVFYVNLMEYLPEKARVEESAEWKSAHLRDEYSAPYCVSSLMLLPHRRCTRSIRFSLPERGSYSFGKYYVTAGDFLGLGSRYKNGRIEKKVVVMPARWEHPDILITLGGYLGDISVRRFIYEDPVLTIGVRDYTGAEPFRQISWKDTARAGKLQVKNYDYTVDANVTVFLNLDGGTSEDRECCFRIARTVCETLEKRHIPYEFYGNGDLYGPQGELNWLAEGLGSAHFRTLMYALGQSTGLALQSFSAMVERCLRKRRRSRGYIVISPPLQKKDQAALSALRRASETEPCILIGASEKEEMR